MLTTINCVSLDALIPLKESHTDRHNMILFLQRDTLKSKPVGYESCRRNFFDVEEVHDTIDDDSFTSDIISLKSKEVIRGSLLKKVSGPSSPKCVNLEKSEYDADSKSCSTTTGLQDLNHTRNKSSKSNCAREGCSNKLRFDSLFCSDACGISAQEVDLLRSLQYAQELYLS